MTESHEETFSFVIYSMYDLGQVLSHQTSFPSLHSGGIGTSLVVQWLRIHLPMQGTWVRSLV